MEQVFTALSGLLIVVAYIDFVRGTLRGPIEPNRATWLVWLVQDVLMAASALVVGIGPAAVMPVVWGLGAGIMFFLSFTHGTRAPITPMEKTCVALSGFGILLWATTGSPILALVASVGSACIGGIPTLVKAWVRPKTEPMNGWLLMFVATIFSSLAIQRWTFESGFLPITVGIMQISILLPLTLHGLHLLENRSSEQEGENQQ